MKSVISLSRTKVRYMGINGYTDISGVLIRTLGRATMGGGYL